MLEEEVYGANSPIWDPEFSQNAANMATSPPTTRKKFKKQDSIIWQLSSICP